MTIARPVEEILDPDLPIVDPHHHLWDRRAAPAAPPADPSTEHGFTQVVRMAPRYLLDELLGQTGDEFKPHENAPQRLADGRVRLPGALRLDEATPWVGVHWEADAYTVGGLVMERLGRLPVAGDVLEVDGVRVEVEKLRGRAVEWLVVTPKVTEADDA